jgi:AbiTii
MNLLDQIIESGTMNTPPPLASVLRQCIVLSSQLKVPVLRTWAERELNGYENAEDLPDYRIVGAGAFGAFDGYRQYPSRPIPAALLEPEHRSRAKEVYLLEPIAAYEGLDRDGTLRFYWPGNMIAYYQSKLLQDSVLVHAWQEIPKSAILGMLDTIRTRVLTTAIDIKTDFENSGVDLATVKQHSPESEKAQQIIINQILHASFYVTSGNITQITQNIEAGNWDSLWTALEKSGIDEAESAELRGTLQHEKTMGEGVKGWIRRNAGKVVEKGLEVGTNVGAKVLTELITRYLGLPPTAG